MGTISKNFSYSEFEATDYAEFKYQNMIADTGVRDAIASLVTEVLQPLRDKWGKPLAINSGYRCKGLNTKVGGVATSQHCKGEAADVCPFGRNGKGDVDVIRQLAQCLVDAGLPFDQAILYPTFLHISHRATGEQRNQILYNRRYTGRKL